MNHSIRIALLSAAALTAAHAAPFMAIGDGAELFATGVIGVRGDDNILLAQGGQKISDTIFDLTPGLELDFGKNAQMQGSVTIADAFSVYTDHSKYNTNLFSGDAVSKYDDGKMKMGFNLGYHELNQNTVDVRGLIRRDVGNAGVNGEVGLSELTSVGGAIQYNTENYHPVNYVDSNTYTVPLNFYYKWTPKIDLSLGYQYRDFQARNGNAVDSTDSFYNVGARGEFTPKLTGKVAVGYTTRHFSGGYSSKGLLGLDSSLAYEVTPKTTVQFGASNDFGTSPTGQQQKNLTINGMVTTKLTEEFSVNGGLSYRGITYSSDPVAKTAGRTDDYWEATLGGAYVVNANLRIVGAYVYRTYKSDIGASDFDNNVFSLAANIRY